MNYLDTVKKFNILVEQNGKQKSHDLEQQIVELLTDSIENNILSDEQKIWAYWNISDNFALQRKSNEQYENHKLFEEHLKKMGKDFLWLLVCDATQRYTLILGGFEKYHNELYLQANKETVITDNNYIIQFHAHSTMVHHPKSLITKHEDEVADIAFSKMRELIKRYENDSQILWMKMMYYDALLGYNSCRGINSDEVVENSLIVFNELKHYLKHKEIIENSLLGTWEYWNEKRNMYHQARIINSYLISLIDAGYYDIANKCYSQIDEKEFVNGYFLKKIEVMKENIKY